MVSVNWGTAAATGGASEGWGLVPLYEAATGDEVDVAGSLGSTVGLNGGGVTDLLGWLGNQGAAAFPGTVDQVNQDVSMTPYETSLVQEGLTQADNAAQASYDVGQQAYDYAGDAANIGQQTGDAAQGLALTVGQSAHDTGQASGDALHSLGQTAFDQAGQDQAQLEALGQYLGLTGEQLGDYIVNQSENLGQAQGIAGAMGQANFSNLATAVQGVDNTYNPALATLAAQTGAGAQGFAGNLGALGTQLQGLGADLYGRDAPVFDPRMQDVMLSGAAGPRGYAGQLATLEQRQGPSAAQAQLNLATNQGMQNNLALARSGGGFGENAQAMSQAIAANALAGQDAANQSAMLKAQENAAWRQRQASNLTGAGQMGLGAAQQYGQQTQFGATLEQEQAAQNANAYLAALAQSGQLTGEAARTLLAGQVQSGQLTQQQADNVFQSLTSAAGFQGQGYDVLMQGLQGNAQTQLQGMGLGAQTAQQGQQMGLDAIQSGIQAGQSGTQLAADVFSQGTQDMFTGNELGLAAVDRFLAGGETQLAGIQTADQLLSTALGSAGQAAGIYQAGIQQALDAYNAAVSNAQNWQQLGISQEQAETDRQRNYMELIGQLAQAVGEAIPG